MSRRAAAVRRSADGDNIPSVSSLLKKSKTPPLLSVALVVGVLLLILYSFTQSGGYGSDDVSVSHSIEGVSCTFEVQKAIPILKKAYGRSMRKVLHVGPDTCSVVSRLLNEEDTEAWGIEPYDLEEADIGCKSLVRRGIVRVADIKFPLPYAQNSFSLVIVSDAFDYLPLKHLNKTLPNLSRLSVDGLVIFSGFPRKQRAKHTDLVKFSRPAKLRRSASWIKYFLQTGMKENENAAKKFEEAASKMSYKPDCQVFHLRP